MLLKRKKIVYFLLIHWVYDIFTQGAVQYQVLNRVIGWLMTTVIVQLILSTDKSLLLFSPALKWTPQRKQL